MKSSTHFLWLSLFLILSLINSGFATVAMAKNDDSLQFYRDTIKQAEIEATQSTLDKLPHSNMGGSSDSYTSTVPLTAASPNPTAPLSNKQKAFIPPTVNTPERQSSTTTPPAPTNNDTNNTNPWLKPNTWAAASKINPWAHVPIPSATLPANPPIGLSHTPSPPGPPNIFAPAQQQTTLMPNNTAHAK